MSTHVRPTGIDIGVSVSLNARYFGTSAKGNLSPPRTVENDMYSIQYKFYLDVLSQAAS
jgi:hypothetical protein